MQFSKTQSEFFVMVEMDYIIHTHYQDHDWSTKKFIFPCFLHRFFMFGLVTLARRTLVSNVYLQPLFTHKQATLGESSEEAGLKLAYSHGKSLGLLKPNDQVVVFQKVGDSSVVKIVEYEG